MPQSAITVRRVEYRRCITREMDTSPITDKRAVRRSRYVTDAAVLREKPRAGIDRYTKCGCIQSSAAVDHQITFIMSLTFKRPCDLLPHRGGRRALLPRVSVLSPDFEVSSRALDVLPDEVIPRFRALLVHMATVDKL